MMTQNAVELALDGPAGVPAVIDQAGAVTRRESTMPAPAAPPSIETTLAIAVEKGIDPASLEKLVSLYERIAASRAAQAFNEAMAGFRAECPAIMKVKKADFATKSGGRASYNFAPLEEITKVADPVLYRHGLTYHWDAKTEGKLITVTCVVSHVAGHSRQSSFTCELGGSQLMSEAQKSAATVTFARRYSLVLALGLTTDEDNDARRPDPMPAPDHDPEAPKVGTRAERAQQPDNGEPRVTAADLGNLLREWKNAKKQPNGKAADLAAWARGILQAPETLDLTLVSAWTIDGFEACWQALAEGR